MTHMTIKEAIKQSCTPEAPFLRYQREPLHIFLWDDLTVPSAFSHFVDGLCHGKDYRVKSRYADTVRKFLPWYNLDVNAEQYEAFCFEDPEDVEFIDLDPTEDGPLRPIQGTLVEVTVPVFELFDCYYNNGALHERFKLDVVTTPGGTIKAHTWMTDFDSLIVDRGNAGWGFRDHISIATFADAQDVYCFGGAAL